MLCMHNVRDKEAGAPKGLRKKGFSSFLFHRGKVAELLSSLSPTVCLQPILPSFSLTVSPWHLVSTLPSQTEREREREEEQTVLLSSALSTHHLPHFSSSSLHPCLIYSSHCRRNLQPPSQSVPVPGPDRSGMEPGYLLTFSRQPKEIIISILPGRNVLIML